MPIDGNDSGNIFAKLLKPKQADKFENLRGIPRDEWGHKNSLLRSDIKDIKEISQIISSELALGNISDDNFIKIINERMGLCVIPLFQTYWRNGDEGIKEMAEWFLSRVIVDIRTTRSKKGFENLLQHDAVNRETKHNIEQEGGYKLRGSRQPQETGDLLGGNVYE